MFITMPITRFTFLNNRHRKALSRHEALVDRQVGENLLLVDKGYVILALLFTHTNRSVPNMCPLPLAAGPGCGGRASRGLERGNHLTVAPEGGLRVPCLFAALYAWGLLVWYLSCGYGLLPISISMPTFRPLRCWLGNGGRLWRILSALLAKCTRSGGEVSSNPAASISYAQDAGCACSQCNEYGYRRVSEYS